eukprot:scaffold9343_cov189-Ochromonas_danica.AAC.4
MTAQSTEEDNLSAASSQGHGLLPDHVREKTNTFLSSLRHSSVTFDPVNDCWEVSILASNGYLWCRIILSHSAVKVMPLEGNSEALDSFTRQLEQVLSEPVQEEEEEEEEGVSLLTTWLQSISSDQDDPFGFYSPSTSSLVYKKAIEVLVTAVDVSMREKLSAVQVLLEATESNSPAVLDEVVGNGLVEAVLTLFTSTTTSTSTSISTSTTTSTSTSNVLWDDPYLVKPYGLQILHALLVTNNKLMIVAKIERCPALMDYLHTVSQALVGSRVVDQQATYILLTYDSIAEMTDWTRLVY